MCISCVLLLVGKMLFKLIGFLVVGLSIRDRVFIDFFLLLWCFNMYLKFLSVFWILWSIIFCFMIVFVLSKSFKRIGVFINLNILENFLWVKLSCFWIFFMFCIKEVFRGLSSLSGVIFLCLLKVILVNLLLIVRKLIFKFWYFFFVNGLFFLWFVLVCLIWGFVRVLLVYGVFFFCVCLFVMCLLYEFILWLWLIFFFFWMCFLFWEFFIWIIFLVNCLGFCIICFILEVNVFRILGFLM